MYAQENFKKISQKPVGHARTQGSCWNTFAHADHVETRAGTLEYDRARGSRWNTCGHTGHIGTRADKFGQVATCPYVFPHYSLRPLRPLRFKFHTLSKILPEFETENDFRHSRLVPTYFYLILCVLCALCGLIFHTQSNLPLILSPPLPINKSFNYGKNSPTLHSPTNKKMTREFCFFKKNHTFEK